MQRVVYWAQFALAAVMGAMLTSTTGPLWVEGLLTAALVITVGTMFGSAGYHFGSRDAFAAGYLTCAEEVSRLSLEAAREGWPDGRLMLAVARAVHTRTSHDPRFEQIEVHVATVEPPEETP